MKVDEFTALQAKQMSEATLQVRVEAIARVHGWLAYHTHDSRRSQAGFPDLTLVRDGRIVFAELKSETGRLRPEQREWLEQLGRATEVWVWRPSDYLSGEIERVLR